MNNLIEEDDLLQMCRQAGSGYLQTLDVVHKQRTMRTVNESKVLGCRYAMREALAISAEEGLKEQWQRHEDMHHMLWDGLKSMGLKSFVENDSERLITVNTITVPIHCTALPCICVCLSVCVSWCYMSHGMQQHHPAAG